MKNINAYNDAVMVGSNWVATPFVLNYGYFDHHYEDDYIEYDNESEVYINYFDISKEEYMKKIKRYARPSTYGLSFCCGDMAYAKYGAPNKKCNYIQLLFDVDKCCLKIAGVWLDKVSVPKTTDYSLIGLVKFRKADIKRYMKESVLVTCDTMLFKYTMNMYEDYLYLRFDKSFGKSLQYTGIIRFDNGYNDELGRFLNFSTINATILLEEEYAIMCKNKLRSVHRLAMYE